MGAGEGDRLQRALDWPEVDLAEYDRLYIEGVRVTDPRAQERGRQELVESVPRRLANFIAFAVDPDLFDDVERRTPEPGDRGLITTRFGSTARPMSSNSFTFTRRPNTSSMVSAPTSRCTS